MSDKHEAYSEGGAPEEYWFRGCSISARMMGALRRYLDHGICPGDFLSAVLCNDFVSACARADDENIRNLPAYAGYLYNHAPRGSWGSPEKFSAWMARFKEAE